MNYSDTQLKTALAKMLPEQVALAGFSNEPQSHYLYWTRIAPFDAVKDTELLHLCRLIWNGFDRKQRISYSISLRDAVIKDGGHATSSKEDIDACCENASWNQRTAALAKELRIEI